MAVGSTTPAHGVHSEVGRLRKVLVCSPGLAHERLTPTNSDDLLFDDVMWVKAAQRDHLDFVDKLTDRGVEVVELHDLLARTMAVPGARTWLLDRTIVPNQVGLGLVEGARPPRLSPPGRRAPAPVRRGAGGVVRRRGQTLRQRGTQAPSVTS
ncbi:hypothetical protein BJF83_00950 [Nocardiopsis sp. CNR-923]|uniref:arginine deiminase family protein n=1 Tax=Nocardiopsis sp. CNR-923 TaxID=1904965 RepID=UPI000965DB13|nr:arginine deiminase family protein [Nocardiopsis sp. CNR-923]OLT29193.1 hypothetical protein BJF83_00950 [Nocardiopsis sp. CNR-923]